MNNDLGMGITVSLKDAFTQNASRVRSSMMDLDSSVASASQHMSANLQRLQNAAMLAGAGVALMGIPSALLIATSATQKYLGELSSLGVKDLRAMEDAAEAFTNQWAGTNKADLIASAYDVKSALSHLSDEAVASFTSMASLTAKATKASSQEMVSAFTTAYGIFKPLASDISDMDWAVLFSGAMSQTVASFKTNGSQMADAIKNIGAVASASNIALNEQLAVLGQLQTTMPGSEAGTLYKAFIMKAAEAGQELGLSFIDASGRLRGVTPILQEIKNQFPDLSQAASQVQLKKAFGSDEAVKFVLQMSASMDTLESNIQLVGRSMQDGTILTQKMAQAMNQDIGAQFTLLRQQLGNLSEIMGRTLLPVVKPVINSISHFIIFLQRLAKSMPGVTRVVLTLSMALGAALVVVGALISAVGMIGLLLPSIKTGFMAITWVLRVLGLAFSTHFLPVTFFIAGVILAVYLLKQAWETNFGGIRDIITGAWNKIRMVFQALGELCSSLSGNMGQMSQQMANSLKACGLLDFVITVFRVFYRVREYVMGFWQAFSGSFSGVLAILEPAFRTLFTAIESLAGAVFSVLEVLGLVANGVDGSIWRQWGEILGNVAGVLLKTLAFALKIVADGLACIIQFFALLIRGVVWVGKVIVSAFVEAYRFVTKFLLPVRWVIEALAAVGRIVQAVWQIFTKEVSVIDGLKTIGNAVFDFITTPFRWAFDVVQGVWNCIKALFPSMGRLVEEGASALVKVLLNLPIVSTLREVFNMVKSFFDGDLTFFEAGQKLLVTLGEGLWSAVTFPFKMLSDALGQLRKLLPFSDAKVGPLSTLSASGASLLTTFSQGMSQSQTLPAQSLQKAFDPMENHLVPTVFPTLLPHALNPNSLSSVPSHLGENSQGVANNDPSNAFRIRNPLESLQQPITPVMNSRVVSQRTDEHESGLRQLIEGLFSRIESLAQRPLEVAVTSTIDGRKVASAVYKDMQERRVRNYETL